MRFLILRILTHSELGMFHEYRRQGKEGSKQRAVNFDWDVVDRVFPAAKDSDVIEMELLYATDHGPQKAKQWLKRQEKNWRLEGNCPDDKCYQFVEPGCLFAMRIEAGSIPATGAWAVFPVDDRVTTAILADGESSGLIRSAMIALHESEGSNAWKILSDACPDLFASTKELRVSNSKKDDVTSRGVELSPNPARLVSILSSVGHTMPSAVADLIDNAISADATEIEIKFGRPDAGHGRWITISDNGNGMNEDTLAEAMRIGSNSNYEVNSLGKYGYGLKGASWSQAKVFTVVTKRVGAPTHHLTWDVNDMEGWLAKSNPLESWEEDAVALGAHGTAVLWKEMRPPQAMPKTPGLDPHSSEVMQLERHLALVFHRFLEGKAAGRKTVTIRINENPIKPNNPFGHALATSYDAKTIRIPTERQNGQVTVQAFLLPTEKEIASYHRADGADVVRRAQDLIGLHGKRNETQGVFIYRHDRLIKWGGWHQMWETNDEKTKLARVQVNFDKVLDDAFAINISKQIVQLPQQLQAEIKKLSDVARKDSQKKYRKEAPPRVTTQSADRNSALSGDNGEDNATPESSGGALPSTSAATSAASPSSAQAANRIAVKEVKTDKFLWKLSQGITGALDFQVSQLDENLSALVKQIRSDPSAIASLASFLSGLDEPEIHRKRIAITPRS